MNQLIPYKNLEAKWDENLVKNARIGHFFRTFYRFVSNQVLEKYQIVAYSM